MAVHIYTQTIHRTIQNKQYIEQRKEECGPCPVLATLDIIEIWREGARWINLTFDRDQWRGAVKEVMNLRNILTAEALLAPAYVKTYRICLLISMIMSHEFEKSVRKRPWRDLRWSIFVQGLCWWRWGKVEKVWNRITKVRNTHFPRTKHKGQ